MTTTPDLDSFTLAACHGALLLGQKSKEGPTEASPLHKFWLFGKQSYDQQPPSLTSNFTMEDAERFVESMRHIIDDKEPKRALAEIVLAALNTTFPNGH